MPPKKKKGRVTMSAEIYSALDAMQLQSDKFSTGAVEALRLAHIQFLSRMASELALLGKEDEQFTIQPHHIDECAEKMGFADFADKLDSAERSSDKKKAASRSKKRKKWTTEMEAEQERLLAQSKDTVQQQQKKPP